MLLARESSREGIVGLPPGAERERDLSWHDWSRPVDLTADGTAMLFDETGEGGGSAYAVYLRATDGSAAVRLGDGHALALSPDGKWALSTPHTTPAELVLLPTGPGQPRRIRTGNFANILRAAWSPGGERLLVGANEPGRGRRGSTCSPPRAATSGRSRPRAPARRGPSRRTGRVVAASDADRRLLLYSLDGRRRRARSADAEPGDVPVRFTPDGRSLYVLVRGDGPRGEIHRVDLDDGRARALEGDRARRSRSASTAFRASSSRPTAGRTSTRTCGCSTSSSWSTGCGRAAREENALARRASGAAGNDGRVRPNVKIVFQWRTGAASRTNAASSASATRRTPPTSPTSASTPSSTAGRSRPGSPRSTTGKIHVEREMGYVADVFDEARLSRLPGTDGHRPRPLLDGGGLAAGQRPADRLRDRAAGPLALAHNGNLVNAREIRRGPRGDRARSSRRPRTRR